MKTKISVLAVAMLLAGGLATGPALAGGYHGGHHHKGHGHGSVGFYFGVPFGAFSHPYSYHYRSYPYPYRYRTYYPAPVVIQQQPTVYIEQAPQPVAQPPAPASAYWYYCADSRTYYPYVKECPAGWQRVAPNPG